MKRSSLFTWLALFIILGGVLVRGRDVTRPPVEVHGWRQTETAALARNYAEEGYRLFYPTVDWRGTTPGYVEAELSIYAFTVALMYGLAGRHEFVARLVAIGVWCLAAGLLFSIGRRAFDARTGLGALFFFTFLSPFSIFFGRAIMGDMTAQMFGLLALYAMQRWQTRGRSGWLALAGAGATLAALSKLPLLYIGVPLAVMVFQREGFGALRHPRNWLVALGVLGLVGAWYGHAYRLGLETGLTFRILAMSYEKVGRWKLLTNPGFYQALLFNFTWRLLTTFGALLTGGGILWPRRSRFELPLLAWIGAALAYFLLAGRAVLIQDYYTLALLPPATLFIGKAVAGLMGLVRDWARRDRLIFRLGAVGLAVVGMVGLLHAAMQTAASVNDMFTPVEPTVQAHQTGQWAQAVLPPEAGLIAVGAGMPEGLYFSHRHGLWFDHATPALDGLVEQGWKYLIVFNPYWGGVDVPWLQRLHAERRLIGGGAWFLAYDISQPRVTTPPYAFDPPPQWADQVSLLGYDLAPARVVNGRLHLILYWRADQKMPRGYTAFLHVLDANGSWCGQDDHAPLNGWAPHDSWPIGEVLADPFQVEIPGCRETDTLIVNVGLYLPETLERLPLTTQPNEQQMYTFYLHWPDAGD